MSVLRAGEGVKRLCVAVKPGSAEALSVAKRIAEASTELGLTCVIDRESAGEVPGLTCLPLEESRADVLVSVGGDGTLIYTIHRARALKAPVLGVSVSESYGYLNEVEGGEVAEALAALAEGRFAVEEVSFVECYARGSRHLAVNEVMVVSEAPHRAVALEVRIEGEVVLRGKMDGVLVATALGSTAYSLSAGGPILHPEVDALVLTPICPVRQFARPLVVPSGHRVEVRVVGGRALVAGDSFEFGRLGVGESVLIHRSSERFALVRLRGEGYYSKLSRYLRLSEGGLPG